jgi:hypothetical protein
LICKKKLRARGNLSLVKNISYKKGMNDSEKAFKIGRLSSGSRIAGKSQLHNLVDAFTVGEEAQCSTLKWCWRNMPANGGTNTGRNNHAKAEGI